MIAFGNRVHFALDRVYHEVTMTISFRFAGKSRSIQCYAKDNQINDRSTERPIKPNEQNDRMRERERSGFSEKMKESMKMIWRH